VEEERVKSALELAMERISAMPELTPEEIAAQKEKEYGPIGTALAVKYMSGAIDADDLPAELNRHAPDRRQVIRRALVSNLCRGILAEGPMETVMKALNGMLRIAPERRDLVATMEKKIFEIFGEFKAAEEKGFREFSELAYEKLRGLGITGSAVRPNMTESEEWKEKLGRIKQACEPKLEKIKKLLIDEFA
jgi:hypothetical protein